MGETTLRDGPLVPYSFLAVIGVLALFIFVPFTTMQTAQSQWHQETGAIKESITKPCEYCTIQAEPDDGMGYTIRVRYDLTGRARVAVYGAPYKTVITWPMSKFYDSLVWGPYDETFRVSTCGTVFVAVKSPFGEGMWQELKPRMVCV